VADRSHGGPLVDKKKVLVCVFLVVEIEIVIYISSK